MAEHWGHKTLNLKLAKDAGPASLLENGQNAVEKPLHEKLDELALDGWEIYTVIPGSDAINHTNYFPTLILRRWVTK